MAWVGHIAGGAMVYAGRVAEGMALLQESRALFHELGDVRGALKAWSRAVSLPVFDRLEKLLGEGRLPTEKDRRMLLDYFPYSGTMLVLARYYERAGDARKARSAVEKAM